MRFTDDKIAAAIAALPLELERIRADLTAGLREFHNGAEVKGSRPVQIGATGAATLAWSGSGRLVGWSIRATGGAVTVLIRDSRDASGDVLAAIELPAESAETIGLPHGVSFSEGIYVQAVAASAGVIQGAVYLGAVD